MNFYSQMENLFTGNWCRLTVYSLALSFLFLGIGASAANNPLSPIGAVGYSVQSGGIKTELSSEGRQTLASIHDGDYVGYKGFDFDSGVAGFTAHIAASHGGAIEIRLDSPTGTLMGRCAFKNTGGEESWSNVSCKVDHSQAGVRDIYLVFHGRSKKALVNVQSFKFLKTLLIQSNEDQPNLAERVDAVDDEVQSTNSWGMPENGFADNFENGFLTNWTASGMYVTRQNADHQFCAASSGTNFNFALTPNAYINKTDTGGEWRTMAEASLTAEMILDSPESKPGIGFSSKDGKQWIYANLNAEDNSIEVWHKFASEEATSSKIYGRSTNAAWSIRPDVKYRLRMDWSPYSDGLIVFLMDDQNNVLANFRTVIDLPAARHPLMVCSGGPARFDSISFDPTLDGWNFKWQCAHHHRFLGGYDVGCHPSSPKHNERLAGCNSRPCHRAQIKGWRTAGFAAKNQRYCGQNRHHTGRGGS